MSNEEISPETENEMRSRFLENILQDLAGQNEGWVISLTPLGDDMGFRTEMRLIDADSSATIFLSGASAESALAAMSITIARGLSRLEEALATEDEEVGSNDE
jgi:hypothetical protein